MRISELIERLQEIQAVYGDLWVEGNDGIVRYVEDVRTVTDKSGNPVAVRIDEEVS